MKKQLTKALALLLSVLMIASLAACGGGSSGSGSSSGGSSSGGDTSEHVVIEYMVTGDANPNGATDDILAELNKILTEKVNAELKIYYIGWTDYLSKYNLTLAQMDGSVDLVGTATDWLDAWPNAKNGAFLELSEDMLKTYCPQTWESVPAEHWDMCKYNGNIYFVPEDNYAQWTNHGYSYRLDWAKQAGLADGCHSWDDMTTYFKYLAENKDTISSVGPLSAPWNSSGTEYGQMAGGWVTSHSEFISIDGITSFALYGGTKSDPYTIICPMYQDKEMMVEYATLMKQWDEIGVWKTDVLNNSAADDDQEFRDGVTGARQHHTQTWTGHVSDIPDDIPEAEIGFFYFGEETNNVVRLSPTHGAFAVSAASKNPERALMVLELLRNDPDCYNLFNYGIEGRHWARNDEGLRYRPDTYDSAKDDYVINYWWGRNDDLEIRSADLDWDKIDPLYEKYNSFATDYAYGLYVAEVDAIQSKINNINEVCTNYLKQISYGKFNGTPEAIIDEFQAALKQAGIEDVIAELQTQVTAVYG